jgi:hypothetical protein
LSQEVHFKSGKKPRKELRLPQQHFIAADDWIPKMGESAYVAWLMFYTWANRADTDRTHDIIPNSLNKVIKKLGVGREKFYQKIVRPLWNYGLIDFHHYEVGKTTYLNIIVYEYPQNKAALATEPLQKIRCYDTDYQTVNRKNAKKGGRKVEYEPGTKIEPGGVRKSNRGGSKIEPHNNVLNIIINYTNKFNNDSNHHLSLGINKLANLLKIKNENKQLKVEVTDFIMSVYVEMKNIKPEMDDDDYIFTVNKVLQKEIDGKINDFHAYLTKSVIEMIATKEVQRKKEEEEKQNKQNLPKWMTDKKVEKVEKTDKDFLEAKRELEERLKKYKTEK